MERCGRAVVHFGVYLVHYGREMVGLVVKVTSEVCDVHENGGGEFFKDDGEREARLHGKLQVLQLSGSVQTHRERHCRHTRTVYNSTLRKQRLEKQNVRAGPFPTPHHAHNVGRRVRVVVHT